MTPRASCTNLAESWMQRVRELARERAHPDAFASAWSEHFRGWSTDDDGPVPMWWPGGESRDACNLARFFRQHGWTDYDTAHRWSTHEPAAFWRATINALNVPFIEEPRASLSLERGPEHPSWLVGARLNIADTCWKSADHAPAILWGAVGGSIRTYSRHEIQSAARRVASSLHKLGFQPGDRLAIVMPMTPESVMLYLGIIYGGCVVVSIADSFAAGEIARRLRIADAKGVVCVDTYQRGGKPMAIYPRVVEADAPRSIVISRNPAALTLRTGDLSWEDFLGDEEMSAPFAAQPDTAINVLFSSGTTGDPKAIPWTHVTPIKCLTDAYFHHDIRSDDVVVWPTNLGWMMGPWLIFATLGNGGSIGLFEDVTLAAEFGRFVQDARVTMLGVVPTLVRQWRATHAMETWDWSRVRCFSSTGEASHAADMFYLSSLAGMKPVMEYCGGTEIGGGFITSSFLHPNVPGAFACPAMGSRVEILGEDHRPADEGELFLVPPAIGLSLSLLNRDHSQTYFAGCPRGPGGELLRRHGDYFHRLPPHYFVAGGRVDDTMNLGGIKVSSAEIEQVLNRTEGVSETAAVAVRPAHDGPEELVVFVVATASACYNEPNVLGRAIEAERHADLRETFNRALKETLNPLFRVSHVRIVDSLPRTASNKVMRRELRAQFERQ